MGKGGGKEPLMGGRAVDKSVNTKSGLGALGVFVVSLSNCSLRERGSCEEPHTMTCLKGQQTPFQRLFQALV